jgi:hypothetical protein
MFWRLGQDCEGEAPPFERLFLSFILAASLYSITFAVLTKIYNPYGHLIFSKNDAY